MQPLVYAPFSDTLDVPNVVVDGAANRSTVLTLSHWPGTNCPAELRADLSTEMAFRYLDEGGARHGSATVVTNAHFDEDGVVGVFALTDPERALAQRELLIDVARAGDFQCFHDRLAARMAMVIDAIGSRHDTASAYRTVLPMLPDLAASIDDHRALWAEEDEWLEETERDLASGRIAIEEVPQLDLAIVTARTEREPHVMALHNRTDAFRVALIRGQQFGLTYRYESWVLYRSRPVLPRVDLQGLAERLTDLEPGAVEWQADAVDDLTPQLRPVGGASELDAARFVDELTAWLAAASTTWSPYASLP